MHPVLKAWNRILGRAQNVQSSFNMLKTIDADHARIHEGVSFRASFVDSLSNDGTAWFLISPYSGDTMHLRKISIKGDAAPYKIAFYETNSINVASLGTQIVPRNFNRSSSNVSSAQVYANPFVVVTGTQIDVDLLPQAGIQGGGQGESPIQEWILSDGGKWNLLSVNNISGGNGMYSVKFDWYEPN